MTTTRVVHAINQILDWLSQRPKNPDNARHAASLAELKSEALQDLADEVEE